MTRLPLSLQNSAIKIIIILFWRQTMTLNSFVAYDYHVSVCIPQSKWIVQKIGVLDLKRYKKRQNELLFKEKKGKILYKKSKLMS